MKKPIEKTPYMFVYGTLMSGFSNSRLLRNSLLVDRGTTEEEYTLAVSSIPFLVEEDGKNYVSGEVYKVDEKTLNAIDQLEGHPDWYERKVISIITEQGDKLQAWAYFMQKSKLKTVTVIESGDYREYSYNKDAISAVAWK